jgi:glycosyltransferase involved in cell wall biosynthesis
MRLFVDVTDLLGRRGPRTGIQRVTQAVVSGLEDDERLGLLVHSRALGFRELRRASFAAMAARAQNSPAAHGLASRSRQLAVLAGSASVGFRRGDAILLLGGGWTNTRILDGLARARARHDVRVIRFVHDVMPMTLPHYFSPTEIDHFATYMRLAVQVSDHVVTSSRWNREQIEQLARGGALAPVPVTTAGLGDDHLLDIEPQQPDLDVTAGGYVLAVGSLDIRKNQRVVYQAYHLARARGLALPQLVVAGPNGRLWQENAHLIGRDTTLDPPVVVASRISDRELAWLYLNSLFTIYPSHCEGWGLPIGESLSLGKVCLASNAGAMPEVGGESARYFDPYNPVELLRLIEHLLVPDNRREAERQIQATFRPRTWNDVARSLIALADDRQPAGLPVGPLSSSRIRT